MTRLTWATLCAILMIATKPVQAHFVASDPSTGALLQRALVEKDNEAFDAAIALGSEIAPDVQRFLEHSDWEVKERALNLLCHFPDVAPGVLVAALASTDEILRSRAISYAEEFLDKPEVRSAWVLCFAGNLPSSNADEMGYRMLHLIDSDTRERIVRDLLPRLILQLESYDVRRSRTMILLVGEFGTRGDSAALRSLESLRQSVEGTLPERWKAHDEAEKRQIRRSLGGPLDFSLANLGDSVAVGRFINDMNRRDVEERISRLKLLSSFRPTPELVAAVRSLLDDTADIENVAPSHAAQPLYKRACDFAVDALSAWYTSFPIRATKWGIYSQLEISRAKEWVDARMASNAGP